MSNINNTKSTLHFLINVEFDISRGYSYIELLSFLKTFQGYFRDCYRNKEYCEQELIFKNKTLLEIESRMIELEKKLIDKNKESETLYSKINRKLTIWERISGRIKI